MKRHTIGVFLTRKDAENAIKYITTELKVPDRDISYVYKNTEGEVKEVDAGDLRAGKTASGAGAGATTGAVIGGLAGLAVATGILPVLGSLLVAGPLVTALGLTGAVGTTAAGAVTGAVAGGLIGALTNLGVSSEKAKLYQDRVMAGNILVAVFANEEIDVLLAMKKYNATDVEVYAVTM
jgi:hypothetical protein